MASSNVNADYGTEDEQNCFKNKNQQNIQATLTYPSNGRVGMFIRTTRRQQAPKVAKSPQIRQDVELAAILISMKTLKLK